MSAPWLVCMLVHAPHVRLVDPYCLGAVEFTRKPEWHPAAENALLNSASAHGLAPDGRGFLRARCPVVADSETEARRIARLYALDAVYLMRSTVIALGPSAKLTDAGFSMQLDTLQPSQFFVVDKTWMPGIAFQLDEFAQHEKSVADLILSGDPKQVGELGQCLRRSVHWAAQANDASDTGLRLLALWIAAETLCKVTEDELITDKLLAALGFPRGTYLLRLSPANRLAFRAAKKASEAWERRLLTVFDDARRVRNRIAHEGYREWDLNEERTAKLLVRSLELAVPRLHSLAFAAVVSSRKTVAGMWAHFAPTFESTLHNLPAVDLLERVVAQLEKT